MSAAEKLDEPFYLVVAGCNCIGDYEEASKILDLCTSHRKDTDIVVITEKTRNKENFAEQWAKSHKHECIAEPVDHKGSGNVTFKRDRHIQEIAQKHKDRACLVFWDGRNKQVADNFELAWECQNPLAIYYTPAHGFIKQKKGPELCLNMLTCGGYPVDCTGCEKKEVEDD